MALIETALQRDVDSSQGMLFRLTASLFIASGFVSGFASVSNGLYLLAIGVTLLALISRGKVHRVVIWPTAFLTLLLVSGALVGSLPTFVTMETFLRSSREFLQGEGRVFLTFAPILAAAACRPDDRSIAFVVRIFRLVAWTGIAMATIGQLQPMRGVLYADKTGLLFALTSSKHVAGFMFGTAAMVLLTTHRGRRSTNLLLGIASLGVVVLTGSRTTLIGVALVAVVLLGFKSSSWFGRRTIGSLRAIMVGGLVALVLFQSTLNVPIFKAELLTDGITTFVEGNPKLGTGAYDPRTANALNRFALWSTASDSFFSSPLIGIGAFRFNDQPADGWGTKGVVFLANSGRREHNATTPHNSYIQVVAETGLVGLGFFLAIWLSLVHYLRRQRKNPDLDDAQRADADGALLIIVFAFGTGLTSASLLTPGLSVPVLTFAAAVALRGDLVRRVSTSMGETKAS